MCRGAGAQGWTSAAYAANCAPPTAPPLSSPMPSRPRRTSALRAKWCVISKAPDTACGYQCNTGQVDWRAYEAAQAANAAEQQAGWRAGAVGAENAPPRPCALTRNIMNTMDSLRCSIERSRSWLNNGVRQAAGAASPDTGEPARQRIQCSGGLSTQTSRSGSTACSRL